MAFGFASSKRVVVGVVLALASRHGAAADSPECDTLDQLLEQSHPGVWPPEWAFHSIRLEPHQVDAATLKDTLIQVKLRGFCPSDHPGTWFSGNFTYAMPLSGYGGDFLASIKEELRQTTYLEIDTPSTTPENPLMCPLDTVALESLGPPALRFHFDERHPYCGRYTRLAVPLAPSATPGTGVKLMKWVCQVASTTLAPRDNASTLCEAATDHHHMVHNTTVSYMHTFGALPVDLNLSSLLRTLSTSGLTRSTALVPSTVTCTPGRGGDLRYAEFLPLDFFTLNGVLEIDAAEWAFMESFRAVTTPRDVIWHSMSVPVDVVIDTACVAGCDGNVADDCTFVKGEWDKDLYWDHVVQYPRLHECLSVPSCRALLLLFWAGCASFGLCCGSCMVLYFHTEPVRKVERIQIVYQPVNPTPMERIRRSLFGQSMSPGRTLRGGDLTRDELRSVIVS